jgi:hypothetical protein
VAPSRFVLLATICAAIRCCAGTLQLLGINRIVVTEGRINASTSTLPATSLSGTVGIRFRSERLPLAH